MIKNNEVAMTLLWLAILILLTVLGKKMSNQAIKNNQVLIAKLIATITTFCAFVLVYLLMQSIMPHIIKLMNVFYHH